MRWGVSILSCLVLAATALAQMSPDQAMQRLREAETTTPASPTDPTPTDTDQPFDFASLSPAVQRQFAREAENYIRINDHIWSMELWLRQQRLSTQSAAKSEPYRQPDAPLFYDPVLDRRARTLADIVGEAAAPRLITGSVVQHDPQGLMIQSEGKLLFVTHAPAGTPTEPKSPVLLLAFPDGVLRFNLDGKPAEAPRYRAVRHGPVRRVAPDELARYFARHDLDRFDRWQPRKVWDQPPKAKTIYVDPQQTGATQRTGPNERQTFGMGTAEPTEVITDPGKYHWQWIRGGRRVILR